MTRWPLLTLATLWITLGRRPPEWYRFVRKVWQAQHQLAQVSLYLPQLLIQRGDSVSDSATFLF